MQLDFIKEIVSNVVGKNGEQITNILYKKKNVNEFMISKKLNLTINQTRNLLYSLSDKGIVQFIRKKDSKKGGWYTYFWTLNIKRALELLKNQINAKIKKLEDELQKRKNERFYYCPNSGLEYTEEEALEYNFICPETGEVLQLRDNRTQADELDVQISKLKLSFNEVNQELEEIEKKGQIERRRKLRTEQKKKEEERKAKREKLKRLKKREEAKINKKLNKKRRKLKSRKKKKKASKKHKKKKI